MDRPNPPPKAKAKAKAKRRPNKTNRRGARSNKGLLERSEAGFKDASEELVRRTKAIGSKAKPKKRYVLRITPKIEELRRDWASLSFSERVFLTNPEAVLESTSFVPSTRRARLATSVARSKGPTQSLIRRRRALKVKKASEGGRRLGLQLAGGGNQPGINTSAARPWSLLFPWAGTERGGSSRLPRPALGWTPSWKYGLAGATCMGLKISEALTFLAFTLASFAVGSQGPC